MDDDYYYYRKQNLDRNRDRNQEPENIMSELRNVFDEERNQEDSMYKDFKLFDRPKQK